MFDETQVVVVWLILGFSAIVFLPAFLAYLRKRSERKRETSECQQRLADDQERRREAEERAALAARVGAEEPFLRRITLVELTTHMQAKLNITGTGRTSSLSLALASMVDYPLEVEIPRGTCFQNLNTLKQNMMSIQTISLRLSPRASADAAVPAVCINRRLAVPAAEDGFLPVSDQSPLFGAANLPKPAYLDRLLDSPRFKEGNSRLRQMTIWTITDNLTRKALRDTIRASLARRAHEADRLRGLAGAGSKTVRADAIDREAERETDAILAEVRQLFESVGLEINTYELFRTNALEEVQAVA